MNQAAKGEFTVKLQPLAFEGLPEGSGLGRMSIDKRITGEVVGLSGRCRCARRQQPTAGLSVR